MRTRIKICGITHADDARAALAAGADYLGLVLTESPRRVTLDEARAIRAVVPDSGITAAPRTARGVSIRWQGGLFAHHSLATDFTGTT